MQIRMSNRTKYLMFFGFVGCCLIVLGLAGVLNYKGLTDTSRILEDSIRSQITSTASAARGIIDAEAFVGYVDQQSIDDSHYRAQLASLRQLAKNTGASYIYALKVIDDETVFVFDTDVDAEPFIPYELPPALEDVFTGSSVAGVSNVQDEYGSYSTAATPLWVGPKVVGIVCVDVADDLINAHRQSARRNVQLLLVMLATVLGVACALAYHVIDRMKTTQDDLTHLANYDRLTSLPNRQFLLATLSEMISKDPPEPFALMFVDLDNFKRVNDNAGHDAGDALLQSIGNYLVQSLDSANVFRPGAGILNVAARVGGDEFILIAPGVEEQAPAEQLAKELLEGFQSDELNRYVEKYQVGLSIGIALYPFHTTDYNVLIKYADIAMYHSKHLGKNCYQMYTDEMKDKDQK